MEQISVPISPPPSPAWQKFPALGPTTTEKSNDEFHYFYGPTVGALNAESPKRTFSQNSPK